MELPVALPFEQSTARMDTLRADMDLHRHNFASARNSAVRQRAQSQLNGFWQVVSPHCMRQSASSVARNDLYRRCRRQQTSGRNGVGRGRGVRRAAATARHIDSDFQPAPLLCDASTFRYT